MPQVAAQETIFQNLGSLISLPSTFYNIAGKVQRIAELHEVVDELEADAKLSKNTLSTASATHRADDTKIAASTVEVEQSAAPHGESLCISFEGVDVVSPGGDCFAADVSFSVLQGKGMMVTGRSAAGKTSLVRVLSGLCIATIISLTSQRACQPSVDCTLSSVLKSRVCVCVCGGGLSFHLRHRTLAGAQWQRYPACEWPSWPASPT